MLIGAHPQLAERIAAAAVEQRLLPLPPHLQGYLSVLKQQTEGSGRFDFVLCYDDGSRLLLEVKNVVFAASPAGRSPAAAVAGRAAQVLQVTQAAAADGAERLTTDGGLGPAAVQQDVTSSILSYAITA